MLHPTSLSYSDTLHTHIIYTILMLHLECTVQTCTHSNDIGNHLQLYFMPFIKYNVTEFWEAFHYNILYNLLYKYKNQKYML